MIVLYKKKRFFILCSKLRQCDGSDKLQDAVGGKSTKLLGHVLLFHPVAFLLFAVLHQNDFLLFQYFQDWMAHLISSAAEHSFSFE